MFNNNDNTICNNQNRMNGMAMGEEQDHSPSNGTRTAVNDLEGIFSDTKMSYAVEGSPYALSKSTSLTSVNFEEEMGFNGFNEGNETGSQHQEVVVNHHAHTTHPLPASPPPHRAPSPPRHPPLNMSHNNHHENANPNIIHHDLNENESVSITNNGLSTLSKKPSHNSAHDIVTVSANDSESDDDENLYAVIQNGLNSLTLNRNNRLAKPKLT